jgi:hypothetical protein
MEYLKTSRKCRSPDKDSRSGVILRISRFNIGTASQCAVHFMCYLTTLYRLYAVCYLGVASSGGIYGSNEMERIWPMTVMAWFRSLFRHLSAEYKDI